MFRRFFTKSANNELFVAESGMLRASTSDSDQIRRSDEPQALYRISRALAEGGSFQQKTSRVAEELAGIAEAEYVNLRIPKQTQETLNLVASARIGRLDLIPPASLPFGTDVVGRAFETGEIVYANEYISHPDASPISVSAGVKSALAMPIKFDEQVIGVIVFSSLNKDHFTEPRVALLATVANVLGPLFQTAISAEESAVSDQIATIMISNLNIDDVYEQFFLEVKSLISFDRAVVNAIDVNQGSMYLRYMTGWSGSRYTQGDTVPLSGSMSGHIANDRRTLIIGDLAKGAQFSTTETHIREGSQSAIATPLTYKDEVIGVFFLLSKRLNAFGLREKRILERLASQIAPAIENAELYRQLHANFAEIAVVDKVARILTSTLDIAEVYDQFCDELKTLVDFDRSGITIVDETRSELTMAYYSERTSRVVWGRTFPAEGTQSAKVLESHTTMVVENMEKHSEHWTTKEHLRDGLKSSIISALISGEEAFGTMMLFSRQSNNFGERERVIVERLAAQIAPAIKNAKLYEQINSNSQEMAAVDEVARIITSNLNIKEVYPQFSTEVKKLVNFDRTVISLIDESQDSFTLTYTTLRESLYFYPGQVVPAKGTFAGMAIETLRTIICGELAEENQFWSVEHLLNDGIRSLIAVPLVSTGRILGSFVLFSNRPNTYGPREQRIVERLAKQIAPAIDNSRLYQEVQQQSLALASIADSVNFVDLKGNLQFVNNAFEQLYGYTADEVMGMPVNILATQELNIASESQRMMEIGLQGVWRGETKRMRKNGEEFAVFLTVAPVKDSSGQVLGFVGVSQDLTESKAAEQRLNDAARLASIGELASGVAHEINNPLTSVLGFSQLLLASEAPEEIKSDIQKIYSEAQRAAKIVQNLLTFARKSEPKQELTDINILLERALELKSADFNSSGMRISRNFSTEPLSSIVDDHQLTQVFINLLTNAQQAIQSSGMVGHISINSSSSDGVIEVKITDSGPGIDPEVIGKIFEPFFTTKPVGVGTGLGLSICYGIVKDHGGDIWAEDLGGGGTTFHIQIPIVLSDDGEASTGPEVLGDATTRHILVVDDEPIIRELLEKSLQLERYTVDLAEDGEEAWRKLATMAYDCVVLDLKMPVMGGQELFQVINEVDETLAQKVLFITGDTISRDTRDFLTATGRQVLHKPFEIQELLGKVRTLTEISKN